MNVLRPGITMAGGVEVESVESICLRELDDKKIRGNQAECVYLQNFVSVKYIVLFLIHLYFSSFCKTKKNKVVPRSEPLVLKIDWDLGTPMLCPPTRMLALMRKSNY